MPQLIPFYFVNQLSFSFITEGRLLTLINIRIKYILPLFTFQYAIKFWRVAIIKNIAPRITRLGEGQGLKIINNFVVLYFRLYFI